MLPWKGRDFCICPRAEGTPYCLCSFSVHSGNVYGAPSAYKISQSRTVIPKLNRVMNQPIFWGKKKELFPSPLINLGEFNYLSLHITNGIAQFTTLILLLEGFSFSSCRRVVANQR